MISLEDAICNGSGCRARLGPTFLYLDQEGHLSIEGSIALGKRMDLYDRIIGKPPLPPAAEDTGMPRPQP